MKGFNPSGGDFLKLQISEKIKRSCERITQCEGDSPFLTVTKATTSGAITSYLACENRARLSRGKLFCRLEYAQNEDEREGMKTHLKNFDIETTSNEIFRVRVRN